MSTDPTIPRQPTNPTCIASTLMVCRLRILSAPGTARGDDSGAEATGQVVLIVVILVARLVAARVPAPAARARNGTGEVKPAKTSFMTGILSRLIPRAGMH